MTNQKQQQQPRMTPFDALGILDRAAGMATLNRADHVAVQQAVQTIAQALQEAQQQSGAEAPVVDPEKKATNRGKRGSKDVPEAAE